MSRLLCCSRRSVLSLVVLSAGACLGDTELVTPPRAPPTTFTLEFRADSEDLATAAALGWANGIDDPQRGPVDWLFSLQVSKSLPLDGRLSFYAFNAFDRLGSYGGRTTVPRLFPEARFGLEVTMPLGLAWGER